MTDIKELLEEADKMAHGGSIHPVTLEHTAKLVKMIERLADALRQFEWRPVDSMPENKLGLVYFGKYLGADLANWEKYQKRKFWTSTRGGQHPTHWIPLPELPK